MAFDFNFPPGSGPPAGPYDPNNPNYQFPGGNGDGSPPPANGGPPGDGGDGTPPGDGSDGTPPGAGGPPGDDGDGDGGGGLIGADVSDGGLDIIVGDTDGNGDGLINISTPLPGAVVGDSLDGTTVNVINPDSLVDVQVPDTLDATIGDGTVADLIGGVGGDDGANGAADGSGGIEITALHDGDILDVHAPDLADVNVGGGELDGLTDGLNLGGLTDGVGLGSVTDALDVGDGTVGGITVDVLEEDYLAEVHVPDVADATIGGAELGGILGGLDLGSTGDGLVGNLLNIGTGDIAGVDLGDVVDTVSG